MTPKSIAPALPEPVLLRIPSPQARSVEAALEVLLDDRSRRYDVWLMVFARLPDALAVRRRLDEEKHSQSVALVALVDHLESLSASDAMVAALDAVADGLKGVFPSSIPPATLDRLLAGIIDRQRQHALYTAVKHRREAAGLEEARLRAAERTLARKLYSALSSLTGDIAPVHTMRRAAAEFERLYVSRVVAHVDGDAYKAREILGVSRTTFYRYLAEFDLHHLVHRHEAPRDDEPE
ncbi:MAG TPA: hypothetical protein VG389_11975 [Myxococcota bacterium]|jgi:DNA-binding protein Fis|nr:hypothetical protein [Myxococcota bacterium]